MPILVNGQIVTETIINEELQRAAAAKSWAQIPDEAERIRRMRHAAELAATDRVLIQQLAAVDPRPIDPAAVTQELESLRPHFPTGLAESLRKRKPVAAIPIQRD